MDEEKVKALIGAARWLIDDLTDAGEACTKEGIEYDSVKALRIALEALEKIDEV